VLWHLFVCRFVKGAIEQLEAAGIAAGSVDVIISNCVINLSADKPAVLREAYRALAEGGEVYFSGGYLRGLRERGRRREGGCICHGEGLEQGLREGMG